VVVSFHVMSHFSSMTILSWHTRPAEGCLVFSVCNHVQKNTRVQSAFYLMGCAGSLPLNNKDWRGMVILHVQNVQSFTVCCLNVRSGCDAEAQGG